jgi:hypothetical protein
MFKLFSSVCLLVVLIVAFIGCSATDKTEETTQSSTEAKAANGGQKAEQKQYQAVCVTKEEHEGNEYILTKWLDDKDKALMYGQEHSRKRKGHNVIYRERIKPDQNLP